jgi:hypothetical protein
MQKDKINNFEEEHLMVEVLGSFIAGGIKFIFFVKRRAVWLAYRLHCERAFVQSYSTIRDRQIDPFL